MKTDQTAESGKPGDRKNKGVLVGRDHQGQPIYRSHADKPAKAKAPNDTEKGTQDS